MSQIAKLIYGMRFSADEISLEQKEKLIQDQELEISEFVDPETSRSSPLPIVEFYGQENYFPVLWFN